MARDISYMANRLAAELEERLHLRGDGLSAKLRRIGRRAPRWVRRDLRIVAEAAEFAGHPRLASRIQHDEVQAAFRRAQGWLSEVDPVARRWQFLRGVAVGLVFNLLLLAGLGIAVLAAFGVIGPGAGTPGG